MKKEMKKAIMRSTRLRNNCFKNQCASTRKVCISQRTLCVSIVTKAKKNYCNELDHKKLTIKTGKPFFTEKEVNYEKLLLIEEEETTSDNNKS